LTDLPFEAFRFLAMAATKPDAYEGYATG